MTLNAMASRDMLMPVLDPGVDAVNVTLITLPLFHSTGQTAQMNAAIAGGWTFVLLPRFEPAAVLQAFEAEHISCWVGVPTMYWTLLQHVRKEGIDVATRRRVIALRRVRRGADAAGRAPGFRAHVWRARARGLRTLGDVAGRVLQPAASPVQARHGRAADLRVRGRGGRRRRSAAARRRARRGRHSRPQRDEGLLQAPRRDGGNAAKWLAAHRRHRRPRCGRVPVDRRSQEGADSARRDQRLPARGRGRAHDASGRVARGRGRRARRSPGRRGESVRRLAPRRQPVGGRAHRVEPRADGGVQISADRRVPRRPARWAAPARSSSGRCSSRRFFSRRLRHTIDLRA